MSLRFVVTGTGRSGTGYVAHLFRAAGVKCGHEDWFTWVPGVRDEETISRRTLEMRLRGPFSRLHEEWRRRRQGLDGDASWLAVPRLARFNGLVFLQIRHPLEVIASFAARHFFSSSVPNVWRTFASAYFDMTGDDIVDGMRWWIEWNARAAQHAHFTYRLEDLDAELFARILRFVGESGAEDKATQAIDSTPCDVNSGKTAHSDYLKLDWDHLPAGNCRNRLFRSAQKLGYLCPDEVRTP